MTQLDQRNPGAGPQTMAPSFEEQLNPVSRRARRVARAVRRMSARALGRPIDILVEIRWRLGDEIMALPVYEAIHERYAPCRVHVWCNYPEILEDNPHADSVNAQDVHPHRYILLRGARRDASRIEEYALRAGVPAPSARPKLYYQDWNSPILDRLPPGDGPLIAIASGTSWPAKRWPLKYWRRACGELLDQGVRMVELGQGDETIGVGANLVGETTVREAAAVLRAANLLVCSDSGLMHLALAAGAPVLALFGPTDPSILIRGEDRFNVITNGRDCQGCWNVSQRMVTEGVCPLLVPECLGTIASHSVAARALELVRDGR
ncbi:MAG: glycosyltransferase family 9 protein [Candidatus Hydrogenedentes bacterium]|nr:glycosyltransferase family 9 protein [Candidatus Hydrogenedentota bacterium]